MNGALQYSRYFRNNSMPRVPGILPSWSTKAVRSEVRIFHSSFAIAKYVMPEGHMGRAARRGRLVRFAQRRFV